MNFVFIILSLACAAARVHLIKMVRRIHSIKNETRFSKSFRLPSSYTYPKKTKYSTTLNSKTTKISYVRACACIYMEMLSMRRSSPESIISFGSDSTYMAPRNLNLTSFFSDFLLYSIVIFPELLEQLSAPLLPSAIAPPGLLEILCLFIRHF